ncbi:PSME3-interacting protein-like [Hydractinia symbiolongicarpus]|uniref:PSME3-interacting protein-like n=1 Tax=Hydractinia symbiolongicarpus TaxID=13093 RepID=UPI00254B9105|nr:PSME3-interacting protein-like [Hydractinia symbiolongicarpus]XP_057302976.1 PSME3-interacting protein-like [Hydractinia symbiolongicarpus]
MNRFVTEAEVEETKKKRAEEWEKARAAGRELPNEEPQDFRPLYERLKEQKDKKQEEFEDQLKFKNMIYKGLNEEDASFLSTVAKKQAELDAKRFDNESEELQEFRTARESVANEGKNLSTNTKKQKISADFVAKGKSQASLLSSLVVRKRKISKDNEPTDPNKLKQQPDDQGDNKKKKDEKAFSDVKEREGNAEIKNKKPVLCLADYPSSSDDEGD